MASIDGNTATLVVNAEGSQGPFGLGYNWTLPPGVYGSVSNGNTITFDRMSSDDWFEVTLTLTDSTSGATLEVLYAFVAGGPVTPAVVPSPQNYGKLFRDATPDMPAGWEVHHIYQVGRTTDPNEEKRRIAALHARFMRETPPFNVNELERLRAVRPDVHARITQIQADWWAAKQAALRTRDFYETVQRIDLDEYKQFAENLNADYDHLLVKARSASEKFAKVIDLVDNKGALKALAISKPSRYVRYGILAVGAITIFSAVTSFTDGAKVLNAVAVETPESKDAFSVVESAIDTCLTDARTINRVKADSFLKYMTALGAYAKAIKLDPSVANAMTVIGETLVIRYNLE